MKLSKSEACVMLKNLREQRRAITRSIINAVNRMYPIGSRINFIKWSRNISAEVIQLTRCN